MKWILNKVFPNGWWTCSCSGPSSSRWLTYTYNGTLGALPSGAGGGAGVTSWNPELEKVKRRPQGTLENAVWTNGKKERWVNTADRLSTGDWTQDVLRTQRSGRLLSGTQAESTQGAGTTLESTFLFWKQKGQTPRCQQEGSLPDPGSPSGADSKLCGCPTLPAFQDF